MIITCLPNILNFSEHQAARKEQRFKAVHKSKRAAEKIIKNYLKAKALETVTKRKRYFRP